jgi:hypothetical protein
MTAMASSPTRKHLNPDDLENRCETQKACYDTYDQALDAAEWLMEQGHVNPGCHITPYECDRCGRWHVYNRVIVVLPGGRRRKKKSHDR